MNKYKYKYEYKYTYTSSTSTVYYIHCASHNHAGSARRYAIIYYHCAKLPLQVPTSSQRYAELIGEVFNQTS